MIDPEAAEVVRMIFHWYAGGTPASRIVKQLNALEIMPPSVYKTSKGCRGFDQHSSGGVKRNAWALTTVNSILKDEVYIGNLVQGKHKSTSYRTKKMVPTDESEWTVIEGTHEAIIPDEVFAVVHERYARHPRARKDLQTSYPLSGFVECAHCGVPVHDPNLFPRKMPVPVHPGGGAGGGNPESNTRADSGAGGREGGH